METICSTRSGRTEAGNRTGWNGALTGAGNQSSERSAKTSGTPFVGAGALQETCTARSAAMAVVTAWTIRFKKRRFLWPTDGVNASPGIRPVQPTFLTLLRVSRR